MNAAELWEASCRLIQQNVGPLPYRTWIENGLTPVRIEDDKLILLAAGSLFMDQINRLYINILDEAISTTAGRPMQAVVTDHDPGEAMPVYRPHLNPAYTFDTFVVGSGNRFAHAASLAVA